MSDEMFIDNHDSASQQELLDYLGFDGGYDTRLDDEEEEYDVDGIYSDNILEDIDFSDYSGDFKKSFRKVNHRTSGKREIKKVIAPSSRKVIVEGEHEPADIPLPNIPSKPRKRPQKRRPQRSKKRVKGVGVKESVKLRGKRKKKIGKVIVPDDKRVIVKGVNEFMLSRSSQSNTIKNIARYKGKKLKTLTFTFNNANSALDFDFELFNPSMPLDYLQSTSLNLNDKISVSGQPEVQYTDVLSNLLVNPTHVVNAKMIFSGPSLVEQVNQPLRFTNKEITSKVKIFPLQMSQQLDRYQFQDDIVYFNMHEQINRPFCPDGMDVIKYKILAGMTVTFAFFYEQVSMKKVFFKEARADKKLL